MTLTELENEILAVLKAASGILSSTEVLALLPHAIRPRGKNTVCKALLALADKGFAVQHGSSKRYTRYSLRCEGFEVTYNDVYGHWPFNSRRRSNWPRARS